MSNHSSDAIGTPSVLYNAQRPNWFAITDLLEGTLRMRSRSTMYLPKEPLEKDKNYNRRLRRSFLFNGLKSGLEKTISKPFSRTTVVRKPELLPDELKKFHDDVDGKGTNLTTFSRQVFESMIALGHTFMFIDQTDTSEARDESGQLTKAAQDALGVRVLWRHIQATDMFAWEWEDDGSGQRVLKEIRFREVRLEKRKNSTYADEEREYIWIVRRNGEFEVWRANMEVQTLDAGFSWGSGGGGSSNHDILSTYLATRPIESASVDHIKYTEKVKSGKASFPNDRIPLIALYAKKKAEMTSEPALMELAITNLEHWQSSSDQRNILRHARLAQKVITGASPKDLNAENLKAAVDNVITLKNPNAKAFYLEHSGTGIKAGREDLQDLEEKMRQQGMQPMMERTIDATATGTMVAVNNASTDVQAWIQELAAGLKKAYEISAAWLGTEIVDEKDEFRVDVFSDFSAPIIGGKDFEQITKARERGDLSQETALNEMKRRGMLSESVDVEAEIERTTEEGLQADAEENLGATEAGPRTLSAGSTDHTHTVTLDADGHGTSTTNASEAAGSHNHEVLGGVVQAAGTNNHTHPLTDDVEEVIEEGNPFSIVKRGSKYVVINSDTGRVMGTHNTRAEAVAQFRALEANVDD